MINVNLLGSKPKVKGVADKGDALKTAGILILIPLIIAIITGGVIGTMRYLESRKPAELPSNPVTSDKSLIGKEPQKVDYSAQSLIKNRVDIAEPTTSYSALNSLEKLNYECAYSLKLLESLVAIIPQDVDFSLMQIDSFMTLTGQGAVDRSTNKNAMDSKEKINSMLEEFTESPDWQIKPKPETIIRNRGSFYSFNFRVDYTIPFKENPKDRISEKDVPLQSQLQKIKERVRANAQMSGLKNLSSLKRVDANTKGKYKYFYYTLSGDGSFNTVMKYLKSLYKRRETVSFQQLQLKAKNDKLEFLFRIKITVL